MSRFFGPRLVLTAAACAGLLLAQPVGAQREQRERSILVGAVGAKDAPVDRPHDEGLRRSRKRRHAGNRPRAGRAATHAHRPVDRRQRGHATRLPFVRESLPKFVARMADMSPAPQIGLWSFGERPTRRVDVTPNPTAVLDGIKKLFTIQGAGRIPAAGNR
jgi:hypothetical protein